MTCLVDAIENRHVATCDVPGAFMHSDIDEQVHVKLEGEIAELLIKVDPTYAEYASKEKGKTVIYAELSKALYGTLQAALLFWKNLSTYLTTVGPRVLSLLPRLDLSNLDPSSSQIQGFGLNTMN